MNTNVMANCILFLDFDGVICNSINECYVSSWVGQYGDEPTRTAINIDDYYRFVSYRPFIRRGGDYLILQHCIRNGIQLDCQRDFDAVEADLGVEASDAFHACFYEAREHILATEPEYWLKLNPLYEAVKEKLQRLSESHWIITTKKADFAAKILGYHGIDWPVERIICSGKEVKTEIIASILDSDSRECAVLLEDQLDHLLKNQYESIRCYLASWGYVKREWLETKDVPILSYVEAGDFLGEFL